MAAATFLPLVSAMYRSLFGRNIAGHGAGLENATLAAVRCRGFNRFKLHCGNGFKDVATASRLQNALQRSAVGIIKAIARESIAAKCLNFVFELCKFELIHPLSMPR